MRIGCALALLLFVGCAARGPMQYQYMREGGRDVLTPPIPLKQSNRVVLKTNIRGCAVDTEALKLTWKGRSAIVSWVDLQPDQYGRLPVPLLEAIREFRTRAAACLPEKDAATLLSLIAESVSGPAWVGYQIRHGNNPIEGYVDLRPPFVLRLTEPTMRDGKVAGIRVRRWDVSDDRLTLREDTGGEGATAPEWSPFLRLFFLTRRSRADHEAILLGASTPADLNRATAGLLSEGDSYRDQIVRLYASPVMAALQLELPVLVNGKNEYVPVHGTVADALRSANMRQPVSIKVMRPFRGKLIPVTGRDLLPLVLIGGEQVEAK